MNINTITAEDLRRMPDKEGLILQGCGGDLTEWVDGINEMLTKAGILKDGCQFENVAAFQHGELTCLLYPFDDVKLDIGKLALWRLQTHEVYGGTWLSDFVPNYLGGFIETPEALADKPDCPLIGADGNIFNLLGIASRTLREHGLKEQAKEMYFPVHSVVRTKYRTTTFMPFLTCRSLSDRSFFSSSESSTFFTSSLLAPSLEISSSKPRSAAKGRNRMTLNAPFWRLKSARSITSMSRASASSKGSLHLNFRIKRRGKADACLLIMIAFHSIS